MTIKLQNIFLIGPMGAGKSSIGRYLAKELQFTFYDSDKEIETQAGVSIPWIFDVEGEMGFRKREERIMAELSAKSPIVLATGGGSILSSANRAVLAARGIVIYLTVSLQQQLERVSQTHDRPLLLHATDPAKVLADLQKQRELQIEH
jgi:shikimate kinase